MKVVSAKELREGMIAGTNIYSPHGRLLVLENSILTYQMISRIKLYEVKDVAIIEGSLPAPAEERLKKRSGGNLYSKAYCFRRVSKLPLHLFQCS